MATTRKTTTKSSAKTAEVKAAEAPVSAVADTPDTDATVVEEAPVIKKAAKSTGGRKALSSLDPNELVELQSCVEGRLIYVSNAGYYIEWAEFGDVHLVPIGEILKMRNEQPAFFRNHWVYPVSANAQDVISALQLERYYNKLSDLTNFDDIYSYEPEQIAIALQDATPFMKENVARRCAQLVADGVIDSVVVIETVEKATGYPVRDKD